MRLVRRRELGGGDLSAQLRRRVREIDSELERLGTEKKLLAERLTQLAATTKVAKKTRKSTDSGVRCPRCGRDHDFLTDADGYLAHVLEDATDVDLVSEGKPLFCPACGDVFLYRSPS